MKITYDKEANAAYISIKEKITSGEVKKTYCCNVEEVKGFINLDFNVQGKLIGIEILDATCKLPKEILDSF